MDMKLRTLLGSAAVALALTAPTAQANPFFVEESSLVGDSNGEFTINRQVGGNSFAGVGSQNMNFETGNTTLGSFDNQGTGGFAVKIGADNFIAWCLDLFDGFGDNETYKVNNTNPFSDNEPTITPGIRTNIQSLFDTAYDTVLGLLPNDDASAGFQLALWEVVYETTSSNFSVTDGNGNFYVDGGSPDAVTAANGYLAGLSGNGTIEKKYNLFFLDAKNDNRQDLVTPVPVPLPAAGVLLLAGLGGLVAARRLRRRADA
jgi:hypothetical protein